MKHILFLIFAILLISIGSNVKAFVPTEVIEGKQIFLVRESKSLMEHRKGSVEMKGRQISKTDLGKVSEIKDIQGLEISDESILVVTFLVFAAFFIIFHFGDSRAKRLELQ